VLVTVPTFWPVVLPPETELQAALGTGIASLAVGLIGWLFLRRESVPMADVGFDGRAWLEGVGLFVLFWIAVTLVDLLGQGIASLAGTTLAAERLLQAPAWWARWPAMWLGVGLMEEVAFRGYVHNKVVKLVPNRWVGIALAALIFGVWHIPSGLATGGSLVNALLAAGVVFSLFSLIVLNLPYEWTGLLPFLGFYHGFNDYPLLLTMRGPTIVGEVARYVLLFVAVIVYRRWKAKRASGGTGGSA
jgi:membrane protease YdiL (CAAX protease family)